MQTADPALGTSSCKAAQTRHSDERGKAEAAAEREHKREQQTVGKTSYAWIHAKVVLPLKTSILQAVKVIR